VISTSNSVPLVGGDRKAFGVWRSAFSVPGARGDVGVLGVSWRVIRDWWQYQHEAQRDFSPG
jgi:hypothetical protein